MKRLLLFFALCGVRLCAQPSPLPQIQYVTSAPSGACTVAQPLALKIVVPTLAAWDCEGPTIGGAGTYALLASGGGGGGGGMIGDPTGGDPFDVLFVGPTGNLDQDDTFQWYPAANPTVTGMTGLQLGLAEPDLSCCDGPGNSLSVTANIASGNLQQNTVAAYSDLNAEFIVSSFYVSGGTVTAPTNISQITQISDIDYLAYLNGTYLYEAFFNVEAGPTNGGEVGWNVADALGNLTGGFDLGNFGDDVELTIFNQSISGSMNGFSPLGVNILELNQGVPVADGGSLAQLNLATLKMGSATTALPNIFPKTSASATAPGTGGCTLRMEAGTNSGTGKLVAYCGTSATGVTIADNIGASF